MRMRGIAIGVGLVTVACSVGRRQPPSINLDVSPSALSDIVGEWQSDTVGGGSARSTCAWSPQGRAVICEQTISANQGTRHVVNVYSTDGVKGDHFYYYGITTPGEAIAPTKLEIADHVWIYGGAVAEANGLYYRTVNDFTPTAGYAWRTESSPDRVHWTIARKGRATLVRRIER